LTLGGGVAGEVVKLTQKKTPKMQKKGKNAKKTSQKKMITKKPCVKSVKLTLRGPSPGAILQQKAPKPGPKPSIPQEPTGPGGATQTKNH